MVRNSIQRKTMKTIKKWVSRAKQMVGRLAGRKSVEVRAQAGAASPVDALPGRTRRRKAMIQR
jgi:hypothetical protein